MGRIKTDNTIKALKKGKHCLPSLKSSLILVFAISWIVPLAVLSFFIFNQYRNAYIKRTDRLMINAVNVSGSLIKSDIDDAVSKVYRESRGGEWERRYNLIKAGISTKPEYVTWMRSQLISKYYMDPQFSCVALYLGDSKKADSYSGKNGYGFEAYTEKVEPIVNKIRENKDELTVVAVADNRVYLIQNLYTSSFDIIYGTLVTGLDKDKLFEDMPLEERENVAIVINDGDYLTVTPYEISDEDKLSALEKAVIFDGDHEEHRGVEGIIRNDYETFIYRASAASYDINLYYLKNTRELYSEIIRLDIIVIITILAMIPFMVLGYHFIIKHIDRPLERFSEASEKLTKGQFGELMPKEDMPNSEFKELAGSFNNMSEQIKYLFETVYAHKMAAKDAQIAALQAQINPHFLNNTLEMMNWQARMAGDAEVSKMIEALGTVLDSSINRSNDKLVRLADELRSADAFLYIMSMRFGQRLSVTKDVDESLLQVEVPQLILQPILENAIKHGVEKVNTGSVDLHISAEDENIIIDVINSGKALNDEEIDRINKIISGEYKTDKKDPGVHTSIGIYNVNKRIELIFGEEYGLSAGRIDDDKLRFRMIMPRFKRV